MRPQPNELAVVFDLLQDRPIGYVPAFDLLFDLHIRPRYAQGGWVFISLFELHCPARRLQDLALCLASVDKVSTHDRRIESTECVSIFMPFWFLPEIYLRGNPAIVSTSENNKEL